MTIANTSSSGSKPDFPTVLQNNVVWQRAGRMGWQECISPGMGMDYVAKFEDASAESQSNIAIFIFKSAYIIRKTMIILITC